MEIKPSSLSTQVFLSSTTQKGDVSVEQESDTKKQLLTTETRQIEKSELTEEKVKNALESFNEIFKPTHLEFQMHENSGKYFVQVIDTIKKEVIRQIPSKEFLEMMANAKKQLGLLLDKRV